MRKVKNKIAAAMIVLFLLSLFSPMVYANEEESVELKSVSLEDMGNYRLADDNRYSTAGIVALNQYSESETVILVRGDSIDGVPQVVDALAASGLAGTEGAPILLTPKNELHRSTKEVLTGLKAQKVIIVGGPQAVSSEVEQEIELMGLQTERIGKENGNRYTTAAAVGGKMMEKSSTDTAIIAGGEALVDSLIAGPLSHEMGYPLLLVERKVPEATRSFITENDIKKLIVVGGPAVVSEEVFTELADLVGPQGEVLRISGDQTYGENRFGTSINFYKAYFKEAESISLVNGRSFVDAVAASVLGKPILYVDQNNLRTDVETILTEKRDFRIIGGPAVVSDGVLEDAFYTLFPHLKPEEPDDNLKISIQHTNYDITLSEMVDLQTSFVRITGSTVNVREEPTTDPVNTDNVIGKVYKDQEFKFNDTKRVTDVGGDDFIWYEIDLRESNINHEKGWVRGDLLDKISRAQTDLYGVGLNGSIWQDARREDVKYYVNPANFSYDHDTENSVKTRWDKTNIRKDPSTNNDALTQVGAGEVFKYVNTEIQVIDSETEYLWYEVDIERLGLEQDTGWLREDIVEKLDEDSFDISFIPTSFFQFLVLSGQSGANTEDLNNILKNKGILHHTGEHFMKAGEQSTINEIYLVAHALLETGNGGSALATGAIRVGEIEANKWVSVQPQSEGKDKKMIAHRYLAEGRWRWNLYEDEDFDLSKVDLKKTYNMFGIGAVDSAPYTRGSVEAYRQGWFTPEKAIVEGGDWISRLYVNHSTYQQDTLYKMRWNPRTPGVHQYATDIGWAVKQTSRIKALYELCENYTLRFDVPEYKK